MSVRKTLRGLNSGTKGSSKELRKIVDSLENRLSVYRVTPMGGFVFMSELLTKKKCAIVFLHYSFGGKSQI